MASTAAGARLAPAESPAPLRRALASRAGAANGDVVGPAASAGVDGEYQTHAQGVAGVLEQRPRGWLTLEFETAAPGQRFGLAAVPRGSDG
jgi:hypothetical protein